jgi:hypothetical protein
VTQRLLEGRLEPRPERVALWLASARSSPPRPAEPSSPRTRRPATAPGPAAAGRDRRSPRATRRSRASPPGRGAGEHAGRRVVEDPVQADRGVPLDHALFLEKKEVVEVVLRTDEANVLCRHRPAVERVVPSRPPVLQWYSPSTSSTASQAQAPPHPWSTPRCRPAATRALQPGRATPLSDRPSALERAHPSSCAFDAGCGAELGLASAETGRAHEVEPIHRRATRSIRPFADPGGGRRRDVGAPTCHRHCAPRAKRIPRRRGHACSRNRNLAPRWAIVVWSIGG